MYIRAAATISHQDSFAKKGVFMQFEPLSKDSALIEPEYRDFIPAMMRRRMSIATKMGVTCALKAAQDAEFVQPDAIIVGTGLGLGVNTGKFLENVYHEAQRTISPTPFSVSTANSIAGQISLLLKNHGYNNTHTQDSLSFEHALIDAELCLTEGRKTVLVGGSDELDDRLFNYDVRLGINDKLLGIGASFFAVADEKHGTSPRIDAVEAWALEKAPGKRISGILNNYGHEDVDLLLYCDPSNSLDQIRHTVFNGIMQIDYNTLCGSYLSNSSFAMAYAYDVLESTDIQRVLICNQLIEGNLGLILVSK